LDEFMRLNPGVRVDVRVKTASGPGGLLDMLTTSSAAAPLAQPDLVALPREALETAALKGLLHPYDNLTKAMDGSDWFGYAGELARLQDSIYGLPFAGDALLLAYRPDIVELPPSDWAATLNTTTPLVFPAADPLASFTMAQYQANGGEIRDEQGRPFLDVDTLTQVLAFYAQAEQGGVLPYWLTQYQSDEETWEAFQEDRAGQVITWSARYLENLSPDTGAAQIPTPDGEAFTLATGWVWALATPRAERQELSVALAEFLIDGEFLARWTEAAGYLPPRPSALRGWSNETARESIQPIALSARLLPPADVLTSLGGPLGQAAVQVLKEQIDPLTAAQAAAGSLTGP
jgi:ABC-type glycerol-3-phosphate transport system substrate-binding protein